MGRIGFPSLRSLPMSARRSLFRIAAVLLCAAAWLPALRAAEAEVKSLPPIQARQVLEILRDDAKRAELERTLSVISQAADQVEAPGGAAEEPARPITIEKDSVIAQAFAQAGRWLHAAYDQLRRTGDTVLALRSAGQWWEEHLGTPEARTGALRIIGALALTLGLALGAEALVSRSLRHPRRVVLDFATRRQSAGSALDTDDQHVRILRRLPYALAHGILSLLPLAAFLATTSILTALLGGPRASFYPYLLPLVTAYVATRLTMAALRLVTFPAGAGLRLSRLGDEAAAYLDKRLLRIVATAAFGVAASEIAYALGAGTDARNAISRLVGLLVHGMLIVMVLQRRHAVARWIRGEGDIGLRTLLADAWAPAAVAIIAGLWIVWALGADSGFLQLLSYAWRTALVLLAAVVTSMVLLGTLGRLFYGNAPAEAGTPAPHPYRQLAQRTVLGLVSLVAAVALLEVWGINAMAWFSPGTIGRRLASAAATIGVACVLALVAWEAVNLSINRRMARWTQAGDLVRATRLRTLVPILRTTLFIAIALVVLLTALNELGINIAPLLAGASIIGVAIGFGSQKLVQDFITGIFLLMENAMQVGDSVTLAGVSGTVENLSIRTVRLRAGDGSLHVVPFSSVGTVTNNHRGIGNASIRVSVTADSNLDEVIAAIRNVGEQMRNDPQLGPLMLGGLELWGVDQVDGASITLAGQIRAIDRGRWAVQRGFNERIYRRFRQLGIQMANPQARFLPEKEEAGKAPAAPAGRDDAGPSS